MRICLNDSIPDSISPRSARQIHKIIQLAGSSTGPAIGALTSENRDIWTDARSELLGASPINAASLERIESAILVVALDDTKPVTREQVSQACWTGDGRNRFYDKHQGASQHAVSLVYFHCSVFYRFISHRLRQWQGWVLR